MRSRFGSSVVAAMILAGRSASAEAADEGSVGIGDRVRVTAPSVAEDRIEGTVAAVDRETLTVVLGDDGRRVGVPRSRIARLEVAKGRKSHGGMGALIGAGAGVLLGILASNPPSSASEFQVDGGAVAVGGAIGAGGGALVGALVRTDRWKTVTGDAVTLTIGPVHGRGLALAVRLSF